jgi:hypothetical protein
MAKFKRQLDDMYVEESFDEYYDRIYGKGTKERKAKPTFGDDTGRGFGGAGTKYDRNTGPSIFKDAEAAIAPVRRAEERIRREIAEEEEAKKQGKPKRKVYKVGGYVKAADGCAKKGKTKGRMV